ncbi:MAG TPA: magnesium/cobalt transporter CorA [Gammaproteobacteria bacterium]
MSFLAKRRQRPGTEPGMLLERRVEARIPPRISVIDYDAETLQEFADLTAAQAGEYLASPRVTWMHCQGDADVGLLQRLGAAYTLHPLAMEDVVNGGQRSKVEIYDDRQVFLVLNLPVLRDEELHIEQVSLFLGPTFVVSFHAGPDDIFEPIRQRLRGPVGRFRSSGADYLFYALTDLVVDQAFPLLEEYDDALEELEERVLRNPDDATLETIHFVKRELLLIRKTLWPQREALNQLIRDEHPLIPDATKVYLRDVYDHGIRVLEMTEAFREMATGLLDVYLSSLSMRMNDVMRLLTIIATIFIPLSFLAGVYGMNFNTDSPWNMPELGWRYGYVAFWGVVVTALGGMLWYFRKKNWL